MQQKSGEGSFALRKQPPPLSLKAEEPGAGGLLGTDAGRPEVPARSRCADPGGPGSRGCDLIARRRPAGP